VHLGERANSARGRVGVQHDTDQRPIVVRTLGAVLEDLGPRVVHQPHVGSVREIAGAE
jgi:hypothetical protein